MARRIEFDEEAVLDAAVRCFWAKGYEGASTRELAACMGIAGASLYNTFGDKHALYRRALTRYVEQNFQDRVKRIEGALAPRAAIVAFFDEIVARSVADEHRLGCMIVNSAFEYAQHDEEVRSAITGVLTEIEAFFQRTVAAGQADGSISRAESADDLARSLLATLIGLRVLARVRPEPGLLEGVVRPMIHLLEP